MDKEQLLKQLATLPPEKRAALLRQLQAKKETQATKLSPIPALPRPATQFAPSFGQRRMWFLTQLEPDSTAYNLPSVLRLIGQVNVPAMQQSFQTLIDRHEVLRLVFDVDDGEPLLRPHPDPTFHLTVLDWQRSNGALVDESSPDLDAFIHQEMHTPFDLTQDLPLRATLIHLSQTEHVLLLTAHHIASDGWSTTVLLREWQTCYMAYDQEQTPALSPLPLQYADFAQWQVQQLNDRLETQLNYWQQQLADAPTILELPTDNPRPAVRTHTGAHHAFQLTPTLSRAIQTVSGRTGATPFMILLTALQVVLHRYTGQEDVVVGAPIAGRNRSEIEGLIGFFVNTLAFRTNFADDPTVETLWQRVRNMTLAAYEHQDLPFEKLVDELQLERTLTHTPLFQVSFNYHNTPQTALTLPHLHVERILVTSQISKFDLSLDMTATEDELRGLLTYNRDLFNPDTIARMAGHFEMVLGSMVANPQQRLSALPLLTTLEREQLMVWAAEEVVYEQPNTVHALFEAQAAAWPNKTAVLFEEESYTYRTLNERANQLAHHLRSLGVGPDERVGLFIERSLDILVAMLGVMKAGGAYVPIDPIYPPGRIQFMLEDVGARILLTQEELLDELPQLRDVRLFCLDSDWAQIAQNPNHNPMVPIDPANLMYLLFTSGSTGQPKGVAVEHRNFLNYIQGLLHSLALPSGLSYAIVSTLAADLGATNVFGALCSGGQIHIISYERATDPPALADYFTRHHIDVMKLVPSHFEVLQAFADSDLFIPHHCLILAGEACPWDTIAQVRTLRPGSMVQNHYGPTETVVSALHYPIPEQGAPTHTTAVPLGRPFGNVAAYILDGLMNPVPIGIPGELFLGGPGVSRGYLNRPGRTAQSFVPNPFATKAGERLYRTGDQVRYLANGNIEFLGRIDQQVKIRGYRVETGEIESLLSEYEGVQDAVVVARDDNTGDKRLVAYWVPRLEQITIPELKNHLRQQLPDYMVPSLFVALPEGIPLNPNGKVDRFALPDPDFNQVIVADFTPPRTPEEQTIAAIWQEVLGVEQVGIDDNFFDLGGDSFKAIRAVRQMGDGMRVVELFKHSTIRELTAAATAVAAGEQVDEDELLIRLTPTRSTMTDVVNLVCVPYGGGSAIIYKPLADLLPANYALYALDMPAHDFGQPDEAFVPLPELTTQCVAEIEQRIEGPVVLYGHCVGSAWTVEMAHQLEAAGREVRGIFLGGTFPSPRPQNRLWEWWSRVSPAQRFASNRLIYDAMRSVGGFADVIDPVERDFVIDRMRYDARQAEDYFTVQQTALADSTIPYQQAPIACIIGKEDPETNFYEERVLEWETYSPEVKGVVLPEVGHYFIKHQAQEIVQIIESQLTLWEREEKREEKRPLPKRPQHRFDLFLWVALGQLVSMVGTGFTGFAIGVWALQQTQNVIDFTFITTFALLPGVLVSPIAGALADRLDRRKLMIASDVGAALGTLLIAALLWTDQLQVWHLYISASIGSIANAFQRPAYLAAVAQLVPKQQLGRANGIVQFGMNAGRVLAPLLGGVLVVWIGLTGVVLIDFVTFLFAVTTLLLVRFPDTLFQKREEGVIAEVIGGWRYIAQRPGLMAMLGFFVVYNLIASSVTVLIPPLVLSFTSEQGLGTVLAALSAGVVLGTFVMIITGGTQRRADGMLWSAGLFAVALMVAVIRPSLNLMVLGMFALGLFNSLIDTHWQAIIQAKVPFKLQGRIFATSLMLVSFMMPFGFIASGFLADSIFEPILLSGEAALSMFIGSGVGRGMAFILLVSGALLLLWSVLGFFYRPLRFVEDSLADAVPDGVILADLDALAAEANLS